VSLSDFLRSKPPNHHVRGHIPLDDTLGRVEHGPSHRGVFGQSVAWNVPGTADLYDPDPGRPEFRESEYQPYLWEIPLHPTSLLRAPLPNEPERPEPPDYNACLMTDELFEQAMREAIGASSVPEQPDVGRHDSVGDIMHAHRSPYEPLEEPLGPIQEIEAAISQAQAAASPCFVVPDQPPPAPMHEPGFMDPFGMTGPAM